MTSLIDAINAYNVSECVQDGQGGVYDFMLITTDLNVWAGREVVTVDDLESWINFQQCFSDFHKDVHGFRPRWDTDHYTLSEWKETYASLERQGEEIRKEEERQEKLDIQSFKDAVTKVRLAGAKDFMTAIRWMLQAEDVNPRYRQDVEHYFWDKGILYSEYGKTLINRICPLRRG